MKKIFFVVAISGLTLFACTQKSESDTHIHGDNCKHEYIEEKASHHTHSENCNHDHDHDHLPVQESFTVESESN